VLIRDQFGDTRNDPSYVYRLAIREPTPDFRLLTYPLSPPATQQQQVQTPLASAVLRRGGTTAFGLVLQRRDEFDGEVTVTVEGLPAGITTPGALLGGAVTESSLVLMASDEAAAWAGPIKVIAKGTLAGREVTREARYAVVVWGTANRQLQPAEYRLAPQMELGVIDKDSEPALVRVGEDKVYETALGGSLEIPIKLTRRGEFKDAVKLAAVGLAQPMKPKDVSVEGGKDDAKLEVSLNQQNIRPGAYTFFLKGETKRKYARNPEAVSTCESEQKRLSDMIKQLEAEVKSATEAKDDAAVKAAQAKLKEATDLKTQADKRLDDAKKASQPKDVNVALVSTPVKLRVHASPLKLTSAPVGPPMKPGAKQALSVEVERLYGFTGDVELTLEPPTTAAGLAAEKASLKKEERQAKLEVTTTDKTPPGDHACIVRARGKFNNVAFEAMLPLTVSIDKP
jgi:hypothetical protein